jgi:hypothetical protein
MSHLNEAISCIWIQKDCGRTIGDRHGEDEIRTSSYPDRDLSASRELDVRKGLDAKSEGSPFAVQPSGTSTDPGWPAWKSESRIEEHPSGELSAITAQLAREHGLRQQAPR